MTAQNRTNEDAATRKPRPGKSRARRPSTLPQQEPSKKQNNNNRNRVQKGTPHPRRRKETSKDAKDTAPKHTAKYIQEIYQIPSRDEYPFVPAVLFEQKAFTHTVELLNSTPGTDGKRHRMRTRNISNTSGGGFYTFKATVNLFDGTHFECRGDGRSDKEAKWNASLHLLGLLHQKELLTSIWGEPEIHSKESGKDSGNLDSVNEVFNFAAKLYLVPKVTTNPISAETLAKVQVRGYRTSWPKYECTIELPEHSFKVTGVAGAASEAVLPAAVEFIKRAPQHLESMGVNYSNLSRYQLQLANVQSFVSFYRQAKGRVLTAQTRFETIGKMKVYVGNACLDGSEVIGPEIIFSTETRTKDLALLAGAISLIQTDPEIAKDFETALQAGGGTFLRRVSPVNFLPTEQTLDVMRGAMMQLRIQGSNLKPVELISDEQYTSSERLRSKYSRRIDTKDQALRSEQLKQQLESYHRSEETAEMRSIRNELPINQYRSDVLDLIGKSPYSVVIGATGSGKTTQVPQMLLEAASEAGNGAVCNIICTQPRRIAATSVATRVAAERHEPMQTSVGYQVRHDAKLPREQGSITYCTTGILLQLLQHQADDLLDHTSHIVLDEVHERDILLDFLLIVLKNILKERHAANKTVPKVVLMSATISTELFTNYFKVPDADGKLVPCPSISVPGRLFPVQNQYLSGLIKQMKSNGSMGTLLNDSKTQRYIDQEARFDTTRHQIEDDSNEDLAVPGNLVAAAVAHVVSSSQEGALLVFLPGLEEILEVKRQFDQRPIQGIDFRDENQFSIHILHSAMPAEAQQKALQGVPHGCRKIILSTNIAETSVTIPDVQHVIDSGKLREIRFDSTARITSLQLSWASKANTKQRAGRAGRVQNGNYYALFSEERHNAMKATGSPELLRSDLQEICLDVKAHRFKVSAAEFLSQALEAPNPDDVQSAIVTLQQLEALTPNEQLTPLGNLLAALPVQPALGKMILLGIIFRCLDPILILGALPGARPIFNKPAGQRQEWEMAHQEWLDGSGSEHIGMISAFKHLRKRFEEEGSHAAWRMAEGKFLNMRAFDQVRRTAQQIEEILVQNRLIPYTPKARRYRYWFGDESLNKNSNNVQLIKALALSGFSPNLGLNMHNGWFRTQNSARVMLHPKSALAAGRRSDFGQALFTFSQLMQGSGGGMLQMRDVSEVSQVMALLFGGPITNPERSNILHINGWLPFYIHGRSIQGRRKSPTQTIEQFREAFDTILSQSFQQLTEVRLNNMNVADGTNAYLADDPSREIISESLVEILKLSDNSLKFDAAPLDSREPQRRERSSYRRERQAYN